MSNVDFVIQGGHVACAVSNRDGAFDVHIAADRIVDVVTAGSSTPSSARVIDARGCVVLPGMIDLGVHLRDPGREEDEPLADTLRAALRGGVTTFVALPDTDPPVDGADDVLHRRTSVMRALGSYAVTPDVIVAGCLTRDRKGKEPADIADMAKAGVRVFTDATYIDDADVVRRALEYARGSCSDVLAIVRGPMRDLAAGGVLVEGAVSTRLGLPALPEAADALAAHRHAAIAHIAKVRAHAGPIFSAQALAVIASSPHVSGEVSPWHLLLDERAHLERRYDTALRLSPPLPTSSSRAALIDAVKRGAIAVSSGHRAVPNRTKDLEFAIAEAGASSLSLTIALLLGENVLTPVEIARATSSLPASILGLGDRGKIEKGARADVAIVRKIEGAGDVVDASFVGSRSPANPWLGRCVRARVERTLVAGKVAFERNEERRAG